MSFYSRLIYIAVTEAFYFMKAGSYRESRPRRTNAASPHRTCR